MKTKEPQAAYMKPKFSVFREKPTTTLEHWNTNVNVTPSSTMSTIRR